MRKLDKLDPARPRLEKSRRAPDPLAEKGIDVWVLELEPRPTTKCGGAGSLRRQSAALRLVGHDRQSTRLVEPPRQVLCRTPVSRASCAALTAFFPVSRRTIFCLKARSMACSSTHRVLAPEWFNFDRRDNYPDGPEWSVAHKIMRLLKSKDLLSDERMELLLSFRNSGFSVDTSPTVWPQDTQGRTALPLLTSLPRQHLTHSLDARFQDCVLRKQRLT